MTDFPSDPARPLADQRWLNITRAAAAAPVVLAIVYSLWPRTHGPNSVCSDDSGIITAGLWLATPPYIFSLVHLLGKTAQRLRKGLAWAVVAGSFWGVISLIIVVADVREGSWRDAGLPLLYSVIQIILLTSAIKTYYSGTREKGAVRLLFKHALLFVFNLAFFGSIFVALPDFYSSQLENRAVSAKETLQELNSAEAIYSQTYPQGFSATLALLGPPPAGTATSASAAGLVEVDLTRGVHLEYTFRYTPGPRDANGKITTYTLNAAPSSADCTRWWRFFTDQTKKIHVTHENRPATVDDPEY
jgi:hypothetical protein